MPVSELILPAALIVYFLAAAHDVAARTIPDRCSLALIVLAVSRFVLAGDGTAAMMATARPR
jgi:prepilin peptidase CpaA